MSSSLDDISLDDILGLILVQLEHVGDGAQPWLIIDDVFNVYCRLVLMVGATQISVPIKI